MNVKPGLKTFSVIACLAMAGCMTSEEPVAEKTNPSVKFVNATVDALAKISAEEGEEGKDALAAYCPKIAALSKDLAKALKNPEDGIPQSFQDVISCFDLPATPTEEDWEDLGTKFDDPAEIQELANCVCGNDISGLGGFGAVQWASFSASVSAAAGEAFNASNSNAGGTAYNASNSSAAGGGFNASNSSAGGAGFSAE